MTSSVRPPTPRRELEALARRIYELERRLNIKQTDLDEHEKLVWGTTVVSETTFGLSPAVGAKGTVASSKHTHGTPANPVPGHEAAADPHPSYVQSVGATSPTTSTGGRNPTIGMPAATTTTAGHMPAASQAAIASRTSSPTASTIAERDSTGTFEVSTGTLAAHPVRRDDPRLSDPRTPTAHGSTHQPGGSDAIATAAPGNSAPGQTPNVGTATSLARSDHQHGREAFAAPVSSNFADTNAEGDSSSVARANHRHGREANPVPAHEAAADPHPTYQKESEKAQASGYAGLDSGAKVPVAQLPTAAPIASAFGDTNAEGDSTAVARANHRHGREANPVTGHEAAADPHTGYQRESEKGQASGYAGLDTGAKVPVAQLPTAAPGSSAPGNTATEGTATSVARSDHQHGRESYGQVAGSVAQGDDNRFPTAAQKAALAGTNGSPSSTNAFVTDSDPRNTNARAPSGTAGGVLSGSYPNPGLAQERVINRGNAPGQQSGTAAARPASGTATGDEYYATDTGERSRWNGTAWESQYARDPAAGTPGLRSLGTSSVQAAAGDDPRFPTTAQKSALAGTSGSPSSTNAYVTNDDARNTNARTPTAHASSHQPGGTDAIPTAAPSPVIKQTASAGTSTSLARADHLHDVTTATPGTSAVGHAPGEGSSTSLARADHQHGREAFGTPGASAPGHTANAGTTATPARSDHQHGREAFAAPVASAFGHANNEGTSAAVARADHQHGREANPVTAHEAAADPHTGYQRESEKGQTSGYASLDAAAKVPAAQLPLAAPVASAFGHANAEGTSTSLARADHQHGREANPVTAHEAAGDPHPSYATDSEVLKTTGTQAKTSGVLEIKEPASIRMYTDSPVRSMSIKPFDAVPGGAAGGIIFWDEENNRSTMGTCAGSSFIDIGMQLTQTTAPASGKRITIGIGGSGVAADAHEINFYWATSGGTAGRIYTREGGSTRTVVLDSGIASSDLTATFELESGSSGAQRVVTNARIVQTGGTGRNELSDLSTTNIPNPYKLTFGSTARQMIDLWSTDHGVGVQAGTTYFRSSGGFAWFKGGVHNDGQNNPGTGGTQTLELSANGLVRANGSDAGFVFKDRNTANAEWSFHASSGWARLVREGVGELFTFTSAGTLSLSANIQANGSLSTFGNVIRVSGAIENGSALAPRLRAENGTNTIWFNWSGSVFRCNVDSSEVKTFIIDHPTKRDHHLVHAVVEGPENAVFYRGEAQLINGVAWVTLPPYFEALTHVEGRTVQLTPILNEPNRRKHRDIQGRTSDLDLAENCVPNLAASRVVNGRFKVMQIGGFLCHDASFFWEVKAVRKDVPSLTVEPHKDEVEVLGEGPYKYYNLKKGKK